MLENRRIHSRRSAASERCPRAPHCFSFLLSYGTVSSSAVRRSQYLTPHLLGGGTPMPLLLLRRPVQPAQITLPSNCDEPYPYIRSVASKITPFHSPANKLRYCAGTYVKLNAVTAGHNLQLFTKLTGTVCLILSQAWSMPSPERRDCIPKK